MAWHGLRPLDWIRSGIMFMSFLERFADGIEILTRSAGRMASVCYLLLIIVVLLNVTLRYFFSMGMIEMEEIQWHLYSVGFLLGLAWTQAENSHVRVDILHQRFSARTAALVDLLGHLFLLMPFTVFVFFYSIDFVGNSWALREGSDNPSGLPARYAIKTVMSAGLLFLFLQSVASSVRMISRLRCVYQEQS
ncbi:MAG: TRAP transporter small permease subunit [Sneathiellales bacterium]|nr:TRAP transporter small permease subunit [Sneathiellales bacterium]